MQVAGGGWVQQNCPRNVALVLFAVFLLLWPSDDVGIQEEIFKGRFQHILVDVVEYAHNQLIHIVLWVGKYLTECCTLGRKAVRSVPCQPVHPVQQLRSVFFRVLFQIVECRTQGCFFDLIGESHNYFSFSFYP